MKSTKNIKVYGTLVNGTLDTSVSDNDHNDVLMNAYQLYDGRFGATPASANFQDVINKRLTGITYADGDTTITGDLIVTGSIIGGDLGAHNLSELRDVNIAGIGANKYLKYDGTKWVPSLISLVDISEFDGLNGAVEGQVLKYRNGKWRPSADLVGENPITTINGLDDVDTTGATNGSVLKYNGTTWVVDTDNQTTSLNGLSDVNTSGAVNGSVLKYNGTTWVVGADNTGNNGATDLNGLSDVALSSSSSNQVLSYNGSQWVNKTISLSDLSMPSAQEGQVLKYSNGSWIAANDEQGGSGSTIEGGSEYIRYDITLKKVAYKNMCYQHYAFVGNPVTTDQMRPGDNIMYVYVSDDALNLDEQDTVVERVVYLSQFNNNIPTISTFDRSYTPTIITRNNPNDPNSSGTAEYYLDGTRTSGSTWTYMQPGLLDSTALNSTQSAQTQIIKKYDTVLINQGNSTTSGVSCYLLPTFGTGTTQFFGAPGNSDPGFGAAFTVSVVESDKIVTYGNDMFQYGYSGKADYVGFYDTLGAEKGIARYATSYTAAQMKDKIKFNTGKYFVEVPYNHVYFRTWFSKDYNAPAEIVASIIVRRVINVVNVGQ